MIGVKVSQIVRMTATELSVLFKQPLLNVEAKVFRLVVVEAFFHFRNWELIDNAIRVKHFKQCLAA